MYVFYKIISKILTKILGFVLPEVIHASKAAFVQGQSIHNHILLVFEFLEGYVRKRGTRRCMFQLNL